MKKTIIVIICIMSFTTNAFAKAGPEILKPKISSKEAIEIATHYFNSTKTQIIDGKYLKKNEYILISIILTNGNWEIIFVHPKQNDHSVTYSVSDAENIKILSITE